MFYVLCFMFYVLCQKSNYFAYLSKVSKFSGIGDPTIEIHDVSVNENPRIAIPSIICRIAVILFLFYILYFMFYVKTKHQTTFFLTPKEKEKEKKKKKKKKDMRYIYV